MKKKQRFLGAHISAAGGSEYAVQNGEAIGAECIQFFGSSPRQWKVRMPSDDAVRRYKEAYDSSLIGAAYLHAPYLVNLASPKAALREKSIEALSDHMRIAGLLGVSGVVVHVGSPTGTEKEEGLLHSVRSIERVLAATPSDVSLLLENAASHKKIGSSIADLSYLVRALDSSRIEVCLDTAHACGAELLSEFTSESVARFCDQLDAEIGLSRLALIHANDSKVPFGSEKDRHENIGEGHLGKHAFVALANESRLSHANVLLEVPGFDGKGPDLQNMEILRSCFDSQ